MLRALKDAAIEKCPRGQNGISPETNFVREDDSPLPRLSRRGVINAKRKLMKQYAMTVDLKDDAALIEAYKAHHQAVWPEVVESLKAVGILEMKIYLLGRRMFMVMDTVDDFDPDVDFARYLTLDPRCQEWENLMDGFQQKVQEAQADEKWARMERVFDLNS